MAFGLGGWSQPKQWKAFLQGLAAGALLGTLAVVAVTLLAAPGTRAPPSSFASGPRTSPLRTSTKPGAGTGTSTWGSALPSLLPNEDASASASASAGPVAAQGPGHIFSHTLLATGRMDAETLDLTSALRLKPLCHGFDTTLQLCLQLRNEYDRRMNRAHWSTHAHGAADVQRLVLLLEARCGLTQAELERKSLLRFWEAAMFDRWASTGKRCCGGRWLPRASGLGSVAGRRSVRAGWFGGSPGEGALPHELAAPCGACMDLDDMRWAVVDHWGVPLTHNRIFVVANSTNGTIPAEELPTGTPITALAGPRQAELRAGWSVWRQGCAGSDRDAAAQASAGGNATEEAEAVPVRVSFIMQYFDQAQNLNVSVDSYARCEQGRPGQAEDALPLHTELLVNADEPWEAPVWVERWRQYNFAPGPAGYESLAVGKDKDYGFLFVVFDHNLHENLGFNVIAKASRGYLLATVQDDDLAPHDCRWVETVSRIFDAHSRTAGVSWFGSVKFGHFANFGFYHHMNPGAQWDPAVGMSMDWVQTGNIGPMIFLRNAWMHQGGMPWAPRGQPGIGDWEFTMRLWAAGYRVAAPHFGGDLSKRKTQVGGVTKNFVQDFWAHTNIFQLIQIALHEFESRTNSQLHQEIVRDQIFFHPSGP